MAADDPEAAPPPAALLEFLGEAPSQAALRRPGSSCGQTAAPAQRAQAGRGRGEDSSVESAGIPLDDGGFDDNKDADNLSPAPQAEPAPALAGAEKARAPAGSPSSGSRSRRPPQQPQDPAQAPAKPRQPSSTGGAPPRPRDAGGGGGGTDLGKTATPGPAGLAGMLGQDSADRALRRSGSSCSAGRPRSGSSSSKAAQSQGDARGRSGTPSRPQQQQVAAASVLDLDPLGLSGGKRRFGGRG